MEYRKIWETNLMNNFICCNNIEEFLSYIENGQVSISNINIKDSYQSGGETTNFIDQIALKNNINITYCDSEHNVLIPNNSIYPTIINPEFFNKHFDVIVGKMREQILKKENYCSIPDYCFNNELLEQVLEKNDDITIYDVELSEEQIKKIKDKHVNCYLISNGERKQISTKNLISHYTYNQLKENDKFYLSVDLSEEEIDNFKYFQSGATIIFNSVSPYNGIEYFEKLKTILEKIDKFENKITIKCKVEKRSEFEKSGLLNINFKNIDVVVNNDLYDYSFQQYKEEEKELNNLVSSINDKEMTPFEKYIAVYNVVKNYKPYKENHDNPDESRYIRNILKSDYMVCVGYSKLLVELLDKVGIEASIYNTSVDISYDNGYTQEEKAVSLSGHERVIVHLQDDKYDINGFYVADPTWDNNLNDDYVNYAANTFDSMQKSRRLFNLTDLDYVFDVHNFDEFVEKVNALLKRKLSNKSKNSTLSYQKQLLSCYEDIYNMIVQVLGKIDSKKNSQLSRYKEINSLDRNEQFYYEFLTEIGYYMVAKNNKEIPKQKLYDASVTVKKQLNNYTEEELNKYQTRLATITEIIDKTVFPYQIPESDMYDLKLDDVGRSK